MTVEQAKQLAREMLRDRRYEHTANVADAARRLAPVFGADTEKAELAAWLHDVMKHQSDEVLLKTMAGSAIMSDIQLQLKKKLWHAWAGGIYVKNTLGLAQEIADAAYYHTSGRADMTALEKTVFLADYISAERDFEGVDAVREAVKTGGDEACRLALAQTIASLTQRGSYIEEHTIEAYNFLVCALADKAAL